MNKPQIDRFYALLGKRIKLARQRHIKLSQAALGRVIGMSRTSVVNIEQGRQRIQVHMIRQIADALHVSPADLIPIEQQTQTDFSKAVTSKLSSEELASVARIISSIDDQEVNSSGHDRRESGAALEDIKHPRASRPRGRNSTKMGVKTKHAVLDGDISGFLFRKGTKAVIGVNALHPVTRQRFTVAHELGHFFLGHHGEFFVDRKSLLFRDSKSERGTDKSEVDANKFAATLLMPERLVLAELKRMDALEDDREAMEKIADKFGVSVQALSIRLANLDLA